jgi:hypothetical protein
MARNDSAFDLKPLCEGGPPRWAGTIETEAVIGEDDGPFAVDVLTHPEANPWFCRLRLTGFDFMPDGQRAAVGAWDGSVWMVAGIDRADKRLSWQRIASGLFQPLGVKCVDGKIYVCCRDQIAVLHDLNGDGEADFYENFNNDHQVTEHFHEFAMGLQTDAEGNFYYAKSARHAKPALVPHHGTLLRVSKDGLRTDILAKGFRAANGVCINPDGSFFVTDQEGHWTPKNRINWVPGKGGFYGNMLGYHDVTDTSDEAMLQPVCWITNAFDRSPAELIWVTSERWGPLNRRFALRRSEDGAAGNPRDRTDLVHEDPLSAQVDRRKNRRQRNSQHGPSTGPAVSRPGKERPRPGGDLAPVLPPGARLPERPAVTFHPPRFGSLRFSGAK